MKWEEKEMATKKKKKRGSRGRRPTQRARCHQDTERRRRKRRTVSQAAWSTSEGPGTPTWFTDETATGSPGRAAAWRRLERDRGGMRRGRKVRVRSRGRPHEAQSQGRGVRGELEVGSAAGTDARLPALPHQFYVVR